jgi:hypothetical protein
MIPRNTIPRILFLDHDGVMNRYGMSMHASGLDPHLVQRVRRLVLATDAQIVSSTAWRQHFNKQQLQDILHPLGLRREWIRDTTPILRGETRGVEIATWLARFARPTRFAVLDDNDWGRFDMDPVRAHFVQTDEWKGITEANARRAAKLLISGPVWLAEGQKSA